MLSDAVKWFAWYFSLTSGEEALNCFPIMLNE